MKFAVIAVGILLASIHALSAAPLKTGAEAPQFKGLKWVKNGPVKLSDGKNKKVYIVEFWATWCPPCRMSIPHLSGLQKKYASQGLVVVGISKEAMDKVKSFVAAQNDMDYNVAVDGDGATYASYMEGVNGIPRAFIIGRNGKILWQGHPLRCDAVVEKVIAGNFDVEAQKKTSGLEDQLRKALQGRDVKQAVDLSLKILNIDPENQMAAQISMYAFKNDKRKALDFWSKLIDSHPNSTAPYMNTLKILNETKNHAALRSLIRRYADNFHNDSSKLNSMGWVILDKVPFGRQPLDLALELAKKAVDIAGKEKDKMLLAAYLDTLARSYYAVGRIDLAVKTQERAAKLVSDTKEHAQLTKTLDFYKQTLALGGKQ